VQRRRFKNVLSFPDRLAQEAERLRAEAEKLPPGIERHDLERKARQGRDCRASWRIWKEQPNSKCSPRQPPSTF
jgi:hypothetical protein